jgi:hypothetical protein
MEFKSDWKNQAMRRKLANGEAVDISARPKTPEGHYMLEEFVEDVDYCDAKTEEWIWSIGKHIETGKIFASTTTFFYQNVAFTCLWLR